jgi:hypothetical protein
MFSLEELFCSVDDFCRGFEPQWKQQLLGSELQLRNRQLRLSLSAIMTILIAFHQSGYSGYQADRVQCIISCVPLIIQMKPYSLDLRQKVVETYEAGGISQRQLAKNFRVTVSFV